MAHHRLTFFDSVILYLSYIYEYRVDFHDYIQFLFMVLKLKNKDQHALYQVFIFLTLISFSVTVMDQRSFI